MSVRSSESIDRAASAAQELAALQAVALVAAQGASVAELFAAVAEEIVQALEVPLISIDRFGPGRTSTVVAVLNTTSLEPGDSWPIVGPSLAATVLDTAAPARIDDYSSLPGVIAASARSAGIQCAAGAPIIVDGAVWGMIWVATTTAEPLPPGIEERLLPFTELVGIAVANAETRERRNNLATQEAALRRLATLVARESSSDEIFSAVTAEASRVLEIPAVGLLRFDLDGSATLVAQSETPWDPPPLGTRFTLDGENLVAEVSRTGQNARADDWASATGSVAAMATVLGVRSAVATPVVVEGRTWGTMIAATSREEPLPEDAEARLAQFTGLVATAIANAGAREELSRLAEEQAALRRVAVLVAQEPSPNEVFTAVSEAVGPLLGADLAAMHVFGDDGVATTIAGWSEDGPIVPVGTRLPLDGDSAVARVFRTAAAARFDAYTETEGETAAVARGLSLRSTVGAPILVDGKLWGALMAATRGDQPLPEDAETRIGAFTELVATAVSNAQAREELQRLADEQAALRRVATLVAGGIGPEAVFSAVAAEVGRLFGSDVSAIVRFDEDGMATVLGDLGGPHRPGTRVTLDPGYVVHQVRETARSARFDTPDPSTARADSLARTLGVRSAVASPIVVEGELWGALTAASVGARLTSNAERRLTEFTELVAIAVANTQSRVAVRAAADEQGALRRVATLVAASAAPSDVFAAVTREIALVLAADATLLCRADPDGTAVVVGSSTELAAPPLGTRIPLGGKNLITLVLETGQPARIDSYEDASGDASNLARSHGLRTAVGAPILVEGRLWGLVIAGTTHEEPLPPDAEQRLAGFTELVATAVGNAQAHSDLIASRARIVGAADDARRRIERDLHDGTQQRLLALGLDLQRLRASSAEDDVRTGLERAEHDLESVVEEVRELSRGLHPAQLSRSGLIPVLRTLARRAPIDVELDVDIDERPAPAIETAVYYVVSEALTNVTRYSGVSSATVVVARRDDRMYATIADEGAGGAAPGNGSGLTGLRDRVEALGGRFGLVSVPGHGTTISIELPAVPPATA